MNESKKTVSDGRIISSIKVNEYVEKIIAIIFMALLFVFFN